jgi:type III secretion protein C
MTRSMQVQSGFSRSVRSLIRLLLLALVSACAAPVIAQSVLNLIPSTNPRSADKPAKEAAGKADIESGSPAARRSGILWPMRRFTYRAENKRASEVLQDFASSMGLPAVIAEGVEGLVKGDFNSPPEAFLEAFSKAYGLLWYHDGSALYFYPSNAIQSRLFRLRGFDRRQVTELLQQLRLGDNRYPLRYSAVDQTLLVYGPPRHVELVAAAVEQLDAGAADRNRPVVRIVPLRYAPAADRMLGITLLPGMASMLSELYSAFGAASEQSITGVQHSINAQPPASPVLSTQISPPAPEKMRSLQGIFGANKSLQDQTSRRTQSSPTDPSRVAMGSAIRSADEDRPIFRADEGTNSVLVLGRPQRMAEYIDLITRLDVRQVMVELEATIIDISSDSVDALGVAWSLEGQRGSFSVTPPANGSIAPFRIGTVWSNAGRELLARVDALSAEGKANVVAKPKLLGVASRPATLKDRRSVAVRVPGNLEANLFQIEAGTLLQMTPYVTTHDGQTRIRLSLYIEDGGFEERVVDGIPILKRMEITTEANVLEGESVLVGGITTTLDSAQKTGVPGLSKIPLFGALFRSTSDKRMRSERLFLITPRVIHDIAQLPAAVRPDR